VPTTLPPGIVVGVGACSWALGRSSEVGAMPKSCASPRSPAGAGFPVSVAGVGAGGFGVSGGDGAG
jgi:hypothetical protein